MADPKITSWGWWRVQHGGAPRWLLAPLGLFVVACLVVVLTHLG